MSTKRKHVTVTSKSQQTAYLQNKGHMAAQQQLHRSAYVIGTQRFLWEKSKIDPYKFKISEEIGTELCMIKLLDDIVAEIEVAPLNSNKMANSREVNG